MSGCTLHSRHSGPLFLACNYGRVKLVVHYASNAIQPKMAHPTKTLIGTLTDISSTDFSCERRNGTPITVCVRRLDVLLVFTLGCGLNARKRRSTMSLSFAPILCALVQDPTFPATTHHTKRRHHMNLKSNHRFHRHLSELDRVDVSGRILQPRCVAVKPLTPEGQRAPEEPVCSKGMLTSLGQAQLRATGAFLRDKFITGSDPNLKPLLKGYSRDEVSAWSSNIERTILSAQSLLAGLFPGLDANPAELGKAIQLAEGPSEEILYPQHTHCDRLRELMLEATYSRAQPQLQASEDFAWAREEVRQVLGLPESAHVSMLTVADHLDCLEEAGMELPSWVDQDLRIISRRAALAAIAPLLTDDKEVLRLSVGRVLGLLFTEMQQVMEGRSRKKLLVMLGHDTTLMPLMKTLGLWNNRWPDFATFITIELLEDVTPSSSATSAIKPGGFYVRLSVGNHDVATYNFKDLREALEEFFVSSHEEYLQLCPPHGSESPPKFSYFIAA
eukprot:g39360.t1